MISRRFLLTRCQYPSLSLCRVFVLQCTFFGLGLLIYGRHFYLCDSKQSIPPLSKSLLSVFHGRIKEGEREREEKTEGRSIFDETTTKRTLVSFWQGPIASVVSSINHLLSLRFRGGLTPLPGGDSLTSPVLNVLH